MGEKSKIEWTDATWNPTRGCTRVSEGCRNCYAEKVAARFSGPGLPYEGLTKNGKWNGQIKVVDSMLDAPLRWQRPRRIFVDSMSDLFHENVPDSIITRVFSTMGLADRHVFQVLTKRPERMAHYMNAQGRAIHPNVWLGVSVEDQESANARIPYLLRTSASVRWVSYEPALGPVSFAEWLSGRLIGDVWPTSLDWIVVGGESGSGARNFDVQWARDVIAEGDKSQTAVFVKQLGAYPYDSLNPDMENEGTGSIVDLVDLKGGDISEWPDELRRRDFPRRAA